VPAADAGAAEGRFRAKHMNLPLDVHECQAPARKNSYGVDPLRRTSHVAATLAVLSAGYKPRWHLSAKD
jgi:hypothetical protein